MRLEIELCGPFENEVELRSLFEWLRSEQGLDSTTVALQRADVQPEQMGTLSEVLVVTLGSGGAGAVLANSVRVWLQTRTTNVTVKIKTPKGTCEVTAKHVRNPEELVKEIRSLIARD